MRRPGLQGLFRLENGGQEVVLHFDQPQGLPGDLFRVGGRQGHRVAHVPDLPIEDALAAGCAPPPIRCVFPGKHGFDPRKRQGPELVNLFDQGMGVGAAQYLSVKEVRKLEIIEIGGSSGDNLPGIPAREPFTDIAIGLVHALYLSLAETDRIARTT